MEKFTLEPLREQDMDYVSSIMQERWGLSASEATIEARKYLVHNENTAGFCIHTEDRAVGVGLFDRSNNEISKRHGPWLLLLWVDPNYRGHDLGIKLTKACMNHARKYGYKEVFIDTNDALDYHLKFGWEKVSPVEWHGKPGWILRFDLSK